MAFQLIHTVCEGDTRPQAGHRARCTEGWLCRRVCSWRGPCTVGQVASPLGTPRGRGQGCEVAWDQHLPCAIYRKSGTCTGHAQLAADTTDNRRLTQPNARGG